MTKMIFAALIMAAPFAQADSTAQPLIVKPGAQPITIPIQKASFADQDELQVELCPETIAETGEVKAVRIVVRPEGICAVLSTEI